MKTWRSEMRKYVVVAGALAALAAPSAAMADTAPGGQCLSGPNGLTAKVIGNPLSTDVDATGCDIGVYNPTGDLSGVSIHGAKQYGVYVDGKFDVTGAHVYKIGDQPFDGMQYGVGIYYAPGATGMISGNTVTQYQKNGIVAAGPNTSVSVTGNTVTGLGTVNFIAQNGIVVKNGATATATGNTVSQNHYGGQGWTATGILFYEAQNAPKARTIASTNHVFQNQRDVAIVQ
jgi:hypothetical protein